ncbi:hypothetical protein A2375_02040 [Candidatus Woesebacteria bacterium RIFOXYB1_FULL_31_120]|nr:MAG: hypothetical protein A2375_02040 [Candidatus Woesebacteria bacterium RIFOXYB1_FULL_31_120]
MDKNDPILYKLTNSKKWPEWQPVKRKEFFAILNLPISDKAKLLWNILKMDMRDWPGSVDHGEVKLPQAVMAKYLGCSESQVKRIVTELKNSKLVSVIKKGLYRMNEVEATFVYTQNPIGEGITHDTQGKYPPGMQMDEDEADSVNHIRKKNHINLETINSNPLGRTEKEYQNIWKEMGRPADFDVSDMKFIDEALGPEKPEVDEKGDILDELGIY